MLEKVNKTLRALSAAALDRIAPHLCVFCDQPTGDHTALCQWCMDALEPNLKGCSRCALPYTPGLLCPACQGGTADPEPALSQIVAPWVYDAHLSYFVQRWKYSKQRRLDSIGIKLMLNASICSGNHDIMMATPLHWQRQLDRGFNQSVDLCRGLCHQRPELRDLYGLGPHLVRRRATAKQSLASGLERQYNLDQAFEVRGDVSGLRVLLVDDICTTGATGAAMATALRDAGADHVTLWCIARTPRR